MSGDFRNEFFVTESLEMALLLPPDLQFRWILPVPRVEKLPGDGKLLASLPAAATLTIPRELEEPSPVRWQAAWNDQGLAITAEVSGESRWVCDPDRTLESDGMQIWIDTRDTHDIHRASRFCHLICAMPMGGGDSGREPCAVAVPIPRAKEDGKLAHTNHFLVTAEKSKTGYRIAAWIPGQALNGYDPGAQSRIGFFAMLKDRELGNHPLALTSEFPFDGDPSLWLTLELTP